MSVNVKATAVANLDRAASGLPILLNPRQLTSGAKRSRVGYCAAGAGDGDNSTYRFARIGSAVLLTSIKLVYSAAAGFTALDLGLWDTAANGGLVVSQHLFCTGLDVHLAGGPTEERFTNLAADTTEQQVWQLLGLAADPGREYDVVGTATTRGAAAAKLACLVEYLSFD